jgi:tRNA U34 5-methylaminomethyl-2-thiouridine-forming methyltransferase MnmC
VEQAFGLEQIHGIADRDPANAEPSSDLFLRDSLARAEFAVENRETKRIGYLITSTRDGLI